MIRQPGICITQCQTERRYSEQSTNGKAKVEQQEGQFQIVDLDRIAKAITIMDCRCDCDSELSSFTN